MPVLTKSSGALARYDGAVRRRHGVELLGGVDEAGRGALAGPVVAAVVVLRPGARLPEVCDSKLLKHDQREALVPRILRQAADWQLGWATAAEIDRINILQATLLAARRALAALATPPQYLITDYLKLTPTPCPCEPIVDGDATSQAVAAASILAKVARDRIMAALDPEFPAYGFPAHKGYGTPEHWAAIESVGPSSLHRMTYKGVCFFHTEPAVRARSYAAGALPAVRRLPDWECVLTSAPDCLDPCHYLPECDCTAPPAPLNGF